MQYLRIDGFELAYTEKNASAEQTIFFIHGNSGSFNTWHYQLTDPSLQVYRLIALDLPGHGYSAKSLQPGVDYSPTQTGKLLARVVKHLCKNSPFILCGFSYGTNLIGELLTHSLHPAGVILISMCCIGQAFPMEKVFQLNGRRSVFFYNEEDETIVSNFLLQNLQHPTDANVVVADYFVTDKNFRPNLMKAAVEGKVSDEVAVIQKFMLPLCIVFGSRDNLVQTNYLRSANLQLWENKTHNLSDAGHFVHLDQYKKVNEIIKRYAGNIFISTHVLQHS